MGYNPLDGSGVQTLSERLVALRNTLGLTQKGLAQSLGLCRETVCRWETGRNAPPEDQRELLEALFASQGITLEDASGCAV